MTNRAALLIVAAIMIISATLSILGIIL